MKKILKKSVSLIVMLCLLVALFPQYTGAAGYESEKYFEATGGKVYYTIDDESDTATITGSDDDIVAVIIPAELEGRPLVAIGDHAFDSCLELTSVTLEESATYEILTIGYRAFGHCEKLAVLELPDSVVSIGKQSFDNCVSFETLHMPTSLKYIGEEAFRNCTTWTAIDLSGTQLETIGKSAFISCQAATELKFPTSLREIGDEGFSICIRVESIDWGTPSSLTSIGKEAFSHNGNIKNIETGELLGLESITIPETVNYIGDGAFSSCSNLRSITLPEGLTTISPHTFDNSTYLENINLDNIKVIEEYAFYNCTSLGREGTIIDMPVVEAIKTGAFGHIYWPLTLKFSNPDLSLKTPEGGLYDICEDTFEVAFHGLSDGDIPVYVNSWADDESRLYTFIPIDSVRYDVTADIPEDASIKIIRNGRPVQGVVETPGGIGKIINATVPTGADVIVTIGLEGYYDKVFVKTASNFTEDWDIGAIGVSDFTPIPPTGRMYANITRSDTGLPLSSFEGLALSLKKGEEVLEEGADKDYTLHFPYIIIDKNIPGDEELTLTVTPDSSLKLAGGTTTAKVKDERFSLELKAWGNIKVTTTGTFVGGNNVLVFHEDVLVESGNTKTTPLDGGGSAQIYSSNSLEEGVYTLVAFNKNLQFSSVTALSSLAGMNMVAGTDYAILENVLVVNGGTNTISMNVPHLDMDNKTSFLDNDACSLTLENNRVISGQLITARVFYAFKNESDTGTINVNLPDGAELQYVCSDTEKLADPTKPIETGSSSGVYHIGFVMHDPGAYTVSATITNKQGAVAPLGSANFSVSTLRMVPAENPVKEKSGNKVTVYARPEMEVKLYMDDSPEPVASGDTNMLGRISLNYDLPEDILAGQAVKLRAECGGAEAETEIIYIPRDTTVKRFSFFHAGAKYDLINKSNPLNEVLHYTYVANDDDRNNYWSFSAEIESSMVVEDVLLHVIMMDGKKRSVDMTLVGVGGGIKPVYKYVAEMHIAPAGDHIFEKSRIPTSFALDWAVQPAEPQLSAMEAGAMGMAFSGLIQQIVDDARTSAGTTNYDDDDAMLEELRKELRDLYDYDNADDAERERIDGIVNEALAEMEEQGWLSGIPLFGYKYRISETFTDFNEMDEDLISAIYTYELAMDKACDALTEMFELSRPIQEYGSWQEVYQAKGITITENYEGPTEGYTEVAGGRYYVKFSEEGDSFSWIDKTEQIKISYEEPLNSLQMLQAGGQPKSGGGKWSERVTDAGDALEVVGTAAEVVKDAAEARQIPATNVAGAATTAGRLAGAGGAALSTLSIGFDMGDHIENGAECMSIDSHINNLELLRDHYLGGDTLNMDCYTVIIQELTAARELKGLLEAKQSNLKLNMFMTAAGAVGCLITGGTAAIFIGAAGIVYGRCSDQVSYLRNLKIEPLVDRLFLLAKKRLRDCDEEEEEKEIEDYDMQCRIKPNLDPSGIVYEALITNPLEGVRAEVWYSSEPDGSNPISWSAGDYDQVNPQTTGPDGFYEWYVPEGYWQVRFTKDGYEDAATAWMVVPPPRMNLTTAMVSNALPAVVSAKAYPEYIELIFSQYMDTGAELFLSGGMSRSWQGAQEGLSKVLHITKAGGFTAGSTVSFTMSGAKNYAGKVMANYNSGNLTVLARPSEIIVNYETTMVAKVGETAMAAVRIKDAEGNDMPGVSVEAAIKNSLLAEISSGAVTAVTDEEGKAVFNVTGLMPGLTDLTFSVRDTSLSKTIALRVTVEAMRPQRPTAQIGATGFTDASPKENYITVQSGEVLRIYAESESTIYYTTDDTCPCLNGAGRHIYTGPITLTKNAKYRIAAYRDGMDYSERLIITVTVSGGGTDETPDEPPGSQDVTPGETSGTPPEGEAAEPDVWENPFSDVKEDDWFYENIRFVYEKGLMIGTGKGAFSPQGKTTRGMVVTILWRLAGEPEPTEAMTFTDVQKGKWYYEAVAWAAEKDIVGGYSAASFGPEDDITREQMAKILYKYAMFKEYDVSAQKDLTAFKDAPSSWAVESMQWAVAEGLIKGRGAGILAPIDGATRSECAAILQRFIESKIEVK